MILRRLTICQIDADSRVEWIILHDAAGEIRSEGIFSVWQKNSHWITRIEIGQVRRQNLAVLRVHALGDENTAETLRHASTPGAVLLLDVPHVTDPVRAFDQMKLVAKRMAQTLDATLVDDNRRPLDDAALAAIREQVQATAAALRNVNIEPGSPRALALFGG